MISKTSEYYFPAAVPPTTKVGALVLDLKVQVHFSFSLKPPVVVAIVLLMVSEPVTVSPIAAAPQIAVFCLHAAKKSSSLLSPPDIVLGVPIPIIAKPSGPQSDVYDKKPEPPKPTVVQVSSVNL